MLNIRLTKQLIDVTQSERIFSYKVHNFCFPFLLSFYNIFTKPRADSADVPSSILYLYNTGGLTAYTTWSYYNFLLSFGHIPTYSRSLIKSRKQYCLKQRDSTFIVSIPWYIIHIITFEQHVSDSPAHMKKKIFYIFFFIAACVKTANVKKSEVNGKIIAAIIILILAFIILILYLR